MEKRNTQVQQQCCEYNLDKYDTKKVEEDFPASLQKSLNDVIMKEEYVSHVMEKRKISTVGGNYLSVLYEVYIKGRTSKEEKKTNIFIKYKIPNEQKLFSVSNAYEQERFVYSELSKVFTEIQERAQVPYGERYKMVKFYPSIPEAIMLDNLTRKGFTTPYRMDGICYQYAELTIRQLAKFHGLSFVLQELRPDYFNRKLKPLNHPFNFTDQWNTIYTNAFKVMYSNVSEARQKKLEPLLPVFIKKMGTYFKDKEPIGCVVCHGDFRPNNVLMKKLNGEITKVIPVDYQLIYYGCPINDFMFFIICGTDKKLRKAHLKDLKNLYYDSLKKFVAYFDLSIEALYPRKEFERQFQERLEFGLMLSVFVLPFMFASDEDVPDMGSDDLTDVEFKVDKRYKERAEGILEDYEEWRIL